MCHSNDLYSIMLKVTCLVPGWGLVQGICHGVWKSSCRLSRSCHRRSSSEDGQEHASHAKAFN